MGKPCSIGIATLDLVWSNLKPIKCNHTHLGLVGTFLMGLVGTCFQFVRVNSILPKYIVDYIILGFLPMEHACMSPILSITTFSFYCILERVWQRTDSPYCDITRAVWVVRERDLFRTVSKNTIFLINVTLWQYSQKGVQYLERTGY